MAAKQPLSAQEQYTRMTTAPVGSLIASMAVPNIVTHIISSVYNLADTFFVSMLDSAVQNSAVTLAAPVMLAFNAVNNLFGVGSSSMMISGS